MQQRDDRRDAVAKSRPAEAPERPGDEQDDEHARERDGLDRVLDQLARERWAHHVGLQVGEVRPVSLREDLARPCELVRLHLGRAHGHPLTRGALHLRLGVPQRREDVVDLGHRRRGLEADIEKRAAPELDAGLQTAEGEEDHARNDEQPREREVPPLALDEPQKHRLDRRHGPGLAAVTRGLDRALLDPVQRTTAQRRELDHAVQQHLRDDHRGEEGHRYADPER